MSILLATALAAATPSISDRDVKCMATVIHHEARGEGQRGMEAVGQVVMNRVKSGRFGRDICSVVYQKSQFSNINRAKSPGKEAISIAKRIISGDFVNIIGKRLYFNGIGPRKALRVGRHKFW